MIELDFTNNGRRPSTQQILAAWKRAGKPNQFTLTYGETFAEFHKTDNTFKPWQAYGNGCSGFDRNKLEDTLNKVKA